MPSQKVAIIARNTSFLAPVEKELLKRDCRAVRLRFTGNGAIDLVKAQNLLSWADFAFFDFCQWPLSVVSEMELQCRITARLHGLEVYDHAKEVDWSRIHLVCTNPQWIKFENEVGGRPLSWDLVNIGVDPTPTHTPKKVFGHNVGLIAVTALPRKRIYTTIETFLDLQEQTKRNGRPDWQLHIRRTPGATGFRDAESNEYQIFINQLLGSAESHGIAGERITLHDFTTDVTEYKRFLGGLDVIVSNSMEEGYHVSLFEAMSYGAAPFVHRWIGADTLFPPEVLFFTQRELVDKIMEWEKCTDHQKRMYALKIQKFVRDTHNQEECAKKVVDVILGVEA
jgi:hypothetical protein